MSALPAETVERIEARAYARIAAVLDSDPAAVWEQARAAAERAAEARFAGARLRRDADFLARLQHRRKRLVVTAELARALRAEHAKTGKTYGTLAREHGLDPEVVNRIVWSTVPSRRSAA